MTWRRVNAEAEPPPKSFQSEPTAESPSIDVRQFILENWAPNSNEVLAEYLDLFKAAVTRERQEKEIGRLGLPRSPG